MKKPSIKITDFGIAGIWRPDLHEHTDAGTIMFMPPELLKKEIVNANPAFDTWACGVIMYYLLFGEFPFAGES